MQNHSKTATFLILATIFIPLSTALSQPIPLDEKIIRELTLKASLLLKISRKVKWPNNKSQNLTLCFPQSDYFRGIIELAIKHPRIRMDWKVKENVPLEETRSCDILFLDSDQEKRLGKIIAYLKNYPVLTVGDTEGYSEKGVLVNFLIVDNKLRFKVQKEATKTSSIQIDDELFSLAIE